MRVKNEFKHDVIEKSKWGISISLDGKEDNLFMDPSTSDGEDETQFDDVPEDITVDELKRKFSSS